MKITKNIFQVGGSGFSNSSDAAVYMVTSASSAALIDSGTGKGTNRIIENIKSCGVELTSIKYLFLTHCHYDHTGGANKIRELTGCSIVAQELDSVYLEMGDSDVTAALWYGTFMEPVKVDIKVPGKHKVFRLDEHEFNFYHTPGHSPGSSVLTVISDGKLVLFGQDVHGPLDNRLKSNINDYKASLKFMISLNADILCEGHFGVIRSKEKIMSFIKSYL